MESPIEPNLQQNQPWRQQQIESDDEAAEALFNQIQLSQHSEKINDESIVNPFDDIEMSKTPKKKKKKKKLRKLSEKESEKDSDNKIQLINEKRKQRIKSKKEKKKKKRKLKLLQKVSEKKQRKQNCENEEEYQQSNKDNDMDSDELSSDSMLQNLNPKKKRHLNDGSSKKVRTEKKQGFELKQLGIDGEINYSRQEQDSSDSDQSFSSQRKKASKKNKNKKKNVSKNLDMLKQLMEIGLCVGEEEKQQNSVQKQQNYDHGIQQLYNMKGSKKKGGVKMGNKLFQDLDVNAVEQNNDCLPEMLELTVVPRTEVAPPSSRIKSFLSRTQKLKKVRGIESETKNDQIDKMEIEKAKSSINHLINKKQIQEADQIELQVQVPKILRGASSSELNNSIYFRKMTNFESNSPIKTFRQEKINKKNKLSRQDFFREMKVEVSNRRSKQVTHQLIKKSFRITQLEQIQEVRKKNEEKKRKQALQDDYYEDEENQIMGIEADQKNFQVKLGFMDKKIDNQQQSPYESEQRQEQIAKAIQQNQEQNKSLQKKNEQLINKPLNKQNQQQMFEQKPYINDEQYHKLLELQQGIEQNNQEQEEQQIIQEQDEVQEQQSQQNEREDNPQSNNSDDENNEKVYDKEFKKQISVFSIPLKKQQLQNIDVNNLYVGQQKIKRNQNKDIQIQHQKFDESDQQQSQSEQSISSQQKYEEKVQDIQEQKKRQQEIKELAAQGINLKKNRQLFQSQQKQKEKFQQYQQARKQFKKLRKIATIIKQKKKSEYNIRRAGEFFDQEAEEGSDNEDHDHEVKNINYDEEAQEYEGIDLDADLKELIDNAVDINEANQELAFRKYMEDVKIKDREELKKIMKGEFKRRDHNQEMIDEMQEDEKERLKRMQQFKNYMKKRQEEEGKQLYMKQSEEEEDPDQNKQEQIEQQPQLVDQMNEQNLKRYLDEGAFDTKPTLTSIKPQRLLPQSLQRNKNNQKRNTMKVKEREEEQGIHKQKKMSSHLNQIFMKNKVKAKPMVLMRNFGFASSKNK